jgi:hypothetical protein
MDERSDDELAVEWQKVARGMNSLLSWPPQPSTVVGGGVLAGSIAYLVTGDPVWAGIAAAVVKIVVPDNSTASSGDVIDAIGAIARAFGRPVPPGEKK